MAEETKVWVSTDAIARVINPNSKNSTRRFGSTSSDVTSDDGHVNWGWTFASVVSGGHSGDDGALDGKSPVKVQIEDEESEYNRTTVEIPGKDIDDGFVVMANVHGDEDGSDFGDSDDENGNFEDGACGYPDDLITLTHLHEPAVVHCLKKRYAKDKIYTNTGPILIALNPFKRCNKLYSDRVMKQYWQRGERAMLMGTSKSEDNSEELSPHVYDLADATYRSMMLRLDDGRGGVDQSILVSGESGAGKTVTTKFIMQYLATLSEMKAESGKEGGSPSKSKKQRQNKLRGSLNRSDSKNDVNIEQQVLQSNPILESFGNARTVRNDNSSRFGKFIEIRFKSDGTLIGASIETYLLEKVRLISQTLGERNYHVFYEMLAGMTDEDLEAVRLDDYSAEDFKITSCSGTYDRRDGVKDTDTFEDLVDALEVMGFDEGQRNDLFSIASAVLHLSNLTINPTCGGEECEIDSENEHLESILELLGVTKENLNQAMCYFKIEARGQSYTRAVQKPKAEKGLEALIKATYSAMFDFIVRTINSSITVKKKATGDGKRSRRGSSEKDNAVIGVLDIFGFESFKTNSFEQLCINYCNEALQQQFNLFVLKNEQEEYEREAIKWSFINFPDNQDALDLIWKKGYGILNILDDQCRAPGTTDKTFANDLYQKLTNKPRFEANFRQVGARQFGVFHYAGLVEYDTEGFVEKNRDELPREASELLLSSSSSFVKELASIISKISEPEPSKSARGGKKKAITVGGHFAKQLQELRAKIDLTSPHYVRCLKPNGLLIPDNFDPLMIVEQLRCAGVVEAVRVSRVGYPQRYNHSQFVSRYRTLGLREMKKAAKSSRKIKPVVALVDAIAKKMSVLGKSSEDNAGSSDKIDLLAIGIQVGKTKVFLRSRAFDVLEKMRKDYMATAAVKVQAAARGYIHKRNYDEFRESSLQLQCWVRVLLAEREVRSRRENYNAIRIQSAQRCRSARRAYLHVLVVTRWCQRLQRGALGRARYAKLDKARKAAIIIQCLVRVGRSKSELDKLKHQAKDLQNVAQERDKFRERMEEMRVEMERVKKAAHQEAEEAARTKAEASSHVESEAADAKRQIASLAEELKSTRKQLIQVQTQCEEAIELAESRKDELDEAEESISRLENELIEARSSANTSAEIGEASVEASTMNELQAKLDESISSCQRQEKEIKKLRKELSTAAASPTPQDADSSTSGQSTAELDSLRAEVASLRNELASTQDQLASAQKSTNGVGSHQAALEMEVQSLKSQLESAKKHLSSSSPEYTSLASEVEANELRDENKRRSSESEAGQTTPNSSKSEKKMKKEIAKLKEANKKILETAEAQFASLSDLERQNVELRREVQELKRSSSCGTADDVDEDLRANLAKLEQRLKAEQQRAEDSVAREAQLRTEIAELRLRPKRNDDTNIMHQSISEDQPTDDVATLQYEIERLRNELLVAREETRSSEDTFSADDMIKKYDDLRRLAEAGMQKDLEIEKLKLTVKTQDAQLHSLRDEVTEEDLTFGVREYRDGDTDVATAENEGLRSLNTELSRQLELYKKESDEVKVQLKDERARSELEMKAFSVALQGVDDLRLAAEQMSRELHFIKRNGYVPPGGLTGEETSGSVKNAMGAIESMARANQTIDQPSLSNEESSLTNGGFSLWGVMNQIMTPGQVQTMNTVSKSTAQGLFNEVDTGAKKKKRSKKKRRSDSGGSVISSFF